MRRQRLGHPDLRLFPRGTEREYPLHVRRVGAPPAVLVLLVYNEVLPYRRSFSPVVRRIAESVPAGTVSESFPAMVTTRAHPGCARTREIRTGVEDVDLAPPLARATTRCTSTPVHASWLTQVEAFFSILTRKVLRRAKKAA
jgi:hypothetical protein